MKTCKISGPLLLAFVAISSASQSNSSRLQGKIKVNNGESTQLIFSPLYQGFHKFTVSFGYFKDTHYVHTCFALMLSPGIGSTSDKCILADKHMYVNAQRKSTSDPNSCMLVRHVTYFDDFVGRLDNRLLGLNSKLAIFKFSSPKHMTGPDYNLASGGFLFVKLIIGYIGDCDETHFSESNIVTLPVYEMIKPSGSRTSDSTIIIDSMFKNLKLSSCDNGSPVIDVDGAVAGVLTDAEENAAFIFRDYREELGKAMDYVGKQCDS